MEEAAARQAELWSEKKEALEKAAAEASARQQALAAKAQEAVAEEAAAKHARHLKKLQESEEVLAAHKKNMEEKQAIAVEEQRLKRIASQKAADRHARAQEYKRQEHGEQAAMKDQALANKQNLERELRKCACLSRRRVPP
jgi:colicin import membrane protein